MAAAPLPRIPLSGTTDAAGSATIRFAAPAHFFAHATVAIQVAAGQASFAVTPQGASALPLAFGQGSQTQLGPFLLMPQELCVVTVSQAPPGVQVSGQVMGWQAQQPEELVPLLPTAPGSGLVPNAPTLVTLVNGASSTLSVIGQSVLGVWVGGTLGQLTVLGTIDGSTWNALPALQEVPGSPPVLVYAITAAGGYRVSVSGYSKVLLQLNTAGPVQVTAFATGQQLLPWLVGQQAMASSLPVAIATNQTAVPVTASSIPPTAELATYFASAAQVSKAFTAGQEFQYLVIYHPASVAELIRLRKVVLTLMSISAASNLDLSIRRLTGGTAPSGGTAVTVALANGADAALSGSDVIQTLPGTAGTVDTGSVAIQSYSMGITTATVSPSQQEPIILYDHEDSPNRKPPTIRASTAEGWAVLIKSSGAATIIAAVSAEFSVG